MSINDLEDFEKNIAKITTERWKQLFDLIPIVTETKVFSKSTGMKENSDGSISFPHVINSEIVSEFQNLVYEIGLVNSFDWPAWEDGKKLLNDSKTDYSIFEVKTLCMMITMIVRADRFSEGYLVNCFNDGIILKILLALKKNTKG